MVGKRRRLKCYGHVFRSSGLAKTIVLQGTVKGVSRRDRQKKRWEDSIEERTGLEFAKFQRAVESREKMEETGCEVICGAPTTPEVKMKVKVKIQVLTYMKGNCGHATAIDLFHPPVRLQRGRFYRNVSLYETMMGGGKKEGLWWKK